MDRSSQTTLLTVERALGRYQQPLIRVAAIVSAAAEVLLHPLFVLPLIVVAANGTATSIGIMATVALAAWLLPQLVTDPSLWQGELAQAFSWLLAIRAGLIGVLALLTLFLGGNPSVLLGLLLIIMAAYWATGGLLATGQPTGLLTESDNATGLMPERVLSWTSGLTVLVGLGLVRLLSPEGPGFPGWLTLLAFFSGLLLLLAAGLTWRVKRLPGRSGEAAWFALGLVPSLLVRSPRLRRYLLFRVIQGCAALADPFLLIYALRAFALPWQSAGSYLALFALVFLIIRVAYPSLIAAGHARTIGQAAALARGLAPLLALALPLILRSSSIARLTPNASWLGPVVFGAIVALYALAIAGIEAADTAYMREAPAPAHRAASRALLVLTLTILSFVYVFGGLIIERWGYDGLLMAAAGLGLLGILTSGLLMEVPPAETRPMTGTGALPTFREQAE